MPATIMPDVDPVADPPNRDDEQSFDSPESFTELVRQHHRSIRVFLGRFVRSAEDVDDLAQEVFLTAFRSLDQYDASSPFGAWLFGIARNRALHHLRTELRRRQREANSAQIALAEARLRQAEECDLEETTQENRALQDCLQELPRNSRRLVDDFYFSGRTAVEIARERELKDATVRMTLLRIRRALADCIQRRVPGRERPQ